MSTPTAGLSIIPYHFQGAPAEQARKHHTGVVLLLRTYRHTADMTTWYARSHEWLRLAESGPSQIGLSTFASHEIGEVAHVQLPSPGDTVRAGDLLAEVESVKSINEVIAPCNGTVTRVNTALYDDPTLLNRDPEGAAWLLEISDAELPANHRLLNPQDYAKAIRSSS